jgi:hypothetical protein
MLAGYPPQHNKPERLQHGIPTSAAPAFGTSTIRPGVTIERRARTIHRSSLPNSKPTLQHAIWLDAVAEDVQLDQQPLDNYNTRYYTLAAECSRQTKAVAAGSLIEVNEEIQ